MSAENKPSLASDRVVSLDALRGFDMIWIIGLAKTLSVAAAKSETPFARWLYSQLDHTIWVGFNAWDLIMPLFLFMAGTSLPFALGKRLARGDSKAAIYGKVFWRVVLLWVLGAMCGGRLLEFNLSRLELYSNTLQSIAAGYAIAAIVFLNLRLAGQCVVTALLCVVYWMLLHLVPISEHVNGVVTIQGNFAMIVDKWVLGPFIRPETPYTWVLSSLTFGATTLLGVMGGHVIRSQKLAPNPKVLSLLGLGAAGIVLGYLLHVTGDPIIKRIWTSSMVIYAGGWSFLLLGLFYWIIDVLGYKKWAFVFVVVGMNAILIYVLTHVFGSAINEFAKTLAGGLARHMGFWGPSFVEFVRLTLLWLLLYALYRRKIFIRI